MITLEDCQQRDAADALRPLRALFHLPQGLIYLDGNSLGPMPLAAVARAQDVVAREWGEGLIRSWNSADWFTMPQRLGARIAPLIGAAPDQVLVTDTTSVNLYKVLFAALAMARQDQPERRVVLSERSNFPTDLYIAHSLCAAQGFTLKLLEPHEIASALGADSAVLLLTHVNYRTGAMHDMAGVSAAARQAGALMVWDLAHSAGAVPVDLLAAGADFAVGCSYKYLNGGPGAPAFLWVHPQHSARFAQPLSGWWGHAAPFAFTPDYQPAPGVARYLCGTQPILSLALLDCGLDVFDQAQALGGMAALRAKSLALSELFIALVEQQCSDFGLGLATPRASAERGSQVSLTRAHGAGGHAIMQALIARGVIGDFRAGDGAEQLDILRFGLAPLYLRFEDLWHAVDHLRQVLARGEWQQAQFQRAHAVT